MPLMDQRELDSHVKQLTKCISANEPAENALRLLETLKKDASPTEEMLRVCSIQIPGHSAIFFLLLLLLLLLWALSLPSARG
jgi:hypothetical protein